MSGQLGTGDLVQALVTREPTRDCREVVAGNVYRVRRLQDELAACPDCGDSCGVGVELEGDPDRGAVAPWKSIMFWCTACEVRPIPESRHEVFEKLRDVTTPVVAPEGPKRVPIEVKS